MRKTGMIGGAFVLASVLASAQPAGDKQLPAEVQNVVAAYAAEVSRAKMAFDRAVAAALAKAAPRLERYAKLAGAKDLDMALAIRAKAKELGADAGSPVGRRFKVHNPPWSAVVELLADGRFVRVSGTWKQTAEGLVFSWDGGKVTRYDHAGKCLDGSTRRLEPLP